MRPSRTGSRGTERVIGWPAFLGLAWITLSVLFWYLDPSASEDLGPALSALFWALHVGVPLILLELSQTLLGRIPAFRRLPDWPSVALSGVCGAVLFVPVALALDHLFPDADSDPAGLLDGLVSEAGSTVAPVILVWLGLNAPRLITISGAAVETAPVEAGNFWFKVPAAIGRDLVSLSAELHYLRVTTTAGDALILYPFGQAVADLGTSRGLQVHRSHWVAIEHVLALRKRGEGAIASLANGIEIPVSRRYRSRLQDCLAGRIDVARAG